MNNEEIIAVVSVLYAFVGFFSMLCAYEDDLNVALFAFVLWPVVWIISISRGFKAFLKGEF